MNATENYKEQISLIELRLARLQQKINKAKEQKNVNWAHVGSMTYFIDLLTEAEQALNHIK